MSKRLMIIGAGGHGKVIADIAIRNGFTDIRFIDDCASGDCMGFPIVGTTAEIEAFADDKTEFVIAIGNNQIRKQIAKQYHVHWATLIHPSAQIGRNVTIGTGTVVMACAAVNSCATIGEHCIINTGAIVEHDNMLEDYVHISPNAALGGTVRVGRLTHIGIGATVIQSIRICENCAIGAGAVVVKDIEENGTYVGVPARKMI